MAKQPIELKDNSFSPLSILNAARKAVPAVDYALGAAGIAAAAAIIIGFLGKGQATLIILGAMLVAMLLLFAFAQLVRSKSDAVVHAGVALLWSVTIFFFIFLLFTVTAVAVAWPPTWVRVLGLAGDPPPLKHNPGASGGQPQDPTGQKGNSKTEGAGVTIDKLPELVAAATSDWRRKSQEDQETISRLQRENNITEIQLKNFLIQIGREPGTPQQYADRLFDVADELKRLKALAAAAEANPALSGNTNAEEAKKDAKEALTVGDLRSAGRALSNLLWSWTDPTQKIVFVCWEPGAENFAAEKQLVQTAVTDSWQAAASLRFSGWQQCSGTSKGIRIRVADESPHTKGIGRQLDGLSGGMVLNFTFKDWASECSQPKSKTDLCIRATAVHEFGHALGFVHEDGKPDAPAECRARMSGFSAPTGLQTGPYDPHSVMSYCNPVFLNNGVLSELDKKAVRLLYGTL